MVNRAAVAELNIAREVVIIGFTVIYVTLGTLTVIVTIMAARGLAPQLLSFGEGSREIPPPGGPGH